jgi:peptidoglycan/xylan/chitin deacetylase (PgdA/CDA1 family)
MRTDGRASYLAAVAVAGLALLSRRQSPSEGATSLVKSASADELRAPKTTSPVAVNPKTDVAIRPQIDGRAFPDGVLALTWDDGPDVHTLELARYLHAEHVSGTFFVVDAWRAGVSDDPGTGRGVLHTGYADIPILPALAKLGHRIGNHTLNHVLLSHANGPLIDRELSDNQKHLDSFDSDELRLFRVPGGDWPAEASATVDGDPYLHGLIGPIRWDVDRKDWDNSVSCDSAHPRLECEERSDGRSTRTKPTVVAQRYLASIEQAKHGIVLLHDRVGDVGSRYALTIAQTLVPALEARGYVFSAPVLAFSPLTPRLVGIAGSTLRLVDVDGDGRDDVCVDAEGAGNPLRSCHRSVERTLDDGELRMAFEDGVIGGPLGRPVVAGEELVSPLTGVDLVRFGDLNGDGRLDVCGRARGGSDIVCAFGNSHGFTAAAPWIVGSATVRAATTLELGDVNGDHRADLCVRTEDAVSCGLAP